MNIQNDLNETLELKIKLAEAYIEEFRLIKNKKDAQIWCKSVPENLKDIVLCLLSLAKVKHRFDII